MAHLSDDKTSREDGAPGFVVGLDVGHPPFLRGEASLGGGPRLQKLAQKDDAAEVVGVVGGERGELVAN